MLKKTITYTDFNGISRTEDFYFNLTAAEVTEMEMSTVGGLAEMIQQIVAAKDIPSIVKVFKDLILRSYGIKSPDGKRFMKSQQISEEFAQTNAFSDLYMELATDSDKAAEFTNAIIPPAPAQKPAVVPAN